MYVYVRVYIDVKTEDEWEVERDCKAMRDSFDTVLQVCVCMCVCMCTWMSRLRISG